MIDITGKTISNYFSEKNGDLSVFVDFVTRL